MNRYKYNKTLKAILGKEKFKQLSAYTLRRVKEEFGRTPHYITKKMVYVNNSAVLIIGVLKVKNASNNKICDYLYVNKLHSSKYFIQQDMDKFIEEYSEYINLIAKNISKGEK